MDIKEISKKIYDNNVEKGFWDKPRNVGEMLMLVVSELSEALEADRKGRFTGKFERDSSFVSTIFDDHHTAPGSNFEAYVKDSFEDEIADAVIRLFDISQGLGIDLEWHIAAKMRYNSMRPKMHGKAY